MTGQVWLLLFCLLVGWLVARRTGGSGTAGIAGHAHGDDRPRIATHEAGHVVAARAQGGTVTSARMSNSGGRVQWSMPDPGSTAIEVTQNVAFLRAGEFAAGRDGGCGADRSSVRRELRRLPSGQRGVVLRAGEQRARQIVSSRSGEIARVAARLNERGRL
jgi:hypothetical protein